ncbi:MAG: restriction endonuclease [Bacteroidales bacterium]|nr:restriction endonuclease [Bacteroidales bacterium]
MEHAFTANIKAILTKYYGGAADDLYGKSQLLQYLNIKTKSAQRGSKSRSSFANLYAVYVLVEDYINHGFDRKGKYSNYAGALFSVLLKRIRELPFGSKLQNHALNHRMNEEFKKYFPDCEFTPIVRDLQTNRYWINENLLKVKRGKKTHNLAKAIIEIIDQYSKAKTDSFKRFIDQCKQLETIDKDNNEKVNVFILGLLAPNVDARLFEIVSYAILKNYYKDEKIYWGFSREELKEESLTLYKTGRTNANDGGIDFVMKPLGRFFQVTETLDFKKYFLDIEKIERYPITFVVKSEEEEEELRKKLYNDAIKTYAVDAIVKRYMECIEELINIPRLREVFEEVNKRGDIPAVLDEIILQSKVEFNFDDDED